MSTAVYKPRVLITGVSGLLGSNLSYCWRNKFEILGLYGQHAWFLEGIDTEQIDLLSPEAVCVCLQKFRPQVVVHCAAIADVDRCEVSPELARQTNVQATKNIVDALGDDAKLIYISTDLVYDGLKGQYAEDEPVQLINTYARTKFAGEEEAKKSVWTLIARTNFFGWNVQNKMSLPEWTIHELSQGRSIKGFTDAVFSSCYTFDLADLLEAAIRQDVSGIYHFASQGAMSKFDFLRTVARKAGLDEALIQSASLEAFPFKAKRAKNLSLKTEKLFRDLHIPIPPIEQGIDHFIRDFRNGVIKELNVCPQQRERFT